MNFLDEYRDAAIVRKLATAMAKEAKQPWTIMEVCGGQTHSIVKYGVDKLLPEGIELLHGPGCPVCVTALETIDRAHAIASRHDVIFCSFGDMLRVPGSRGDLLTLKSEGADIRIVYSPLDAVELAACNPERTVVFFAIGFETTAPATATAVWQAKRRGLKNFFMLTTHVLVPPVLSALLQPRDNRIDAFLGPGHVCTIMGYSEYEPIAAAFGVPIVISGFEPVDLLEGILEAIRMLENGEAAVRNAYARVVRRQGNPRARELMEQVFEPCDRPWRGMGVIPLSGYRLSEAYQDHDAEILFDVKNIKSIESPICISGQILKGLKKPRECPAFGRACTPQSPLGATMVSSEGACAAYYAYGRELELQRS